MGMELRCPNCHDNVGKVTECMNEEHCSNCGEHFVNEDKKQYYPIQWERDKDKIYTVSDIIYDTDGEDVDLPAKLEIAVPVWVGNVEDYVSNQISNVTGFCHKGFSTTPEIKERN